MLLRFGSMLDHFRRLFTSSCSWYESRGVKGKRKAARLRGIRLLP
jgi:hypothetical protein